RELEETTKRRFFLVGKEGEHVDHFKVLDQGTLEKVAPKVPVEVDQEVEVKLGEVGLYDPHAGVGKVDDVDIVVGNAAKLVGKKVTARPVAIGDGIVWAELLSPVQAADEPLTAEAEAERPTRARRPTAKKVEERLEEEVADAVAEPEPEEEADADGDVSGDAAVPVKKKTRRGSRGGRNRKRKAAAGEPAGQAPEPDGAEQVPGTEPEQPPEPEDAPAPAPVIHVPDRELTDDDAEPATPTKKRTRRGSRGGRNRRKKTAAVGADGATATATAEAEPEPGPEPEPEPDRER